MFGDDNPRLLELRRRVQADPASMAFAQLAEECRRGGNNEEAVAVCRGGLHFHPGYLSARITLGRALTELGRFDEAQTELAIVLKDAPDNLAANRAMAEILQQKGRLNEALAYYKRALGLAHHDPELSDAVERIEHVVAPPPPSTPVRIEDLFDFDTLLAQLGGGKDTTPAIADTPSLGVVPPPPAVNALEAVALDDRDPFADLEKHLRESEEQRPYQAPAPPVDFEETQHQQRVMAALEDWLYAIIADRQSPASA